jgi:hypothetical protein
MDELRIAREKNMALEEKLRREEKVNLQNQDRLILLEEKCREY